MSITGNPVNFFPVYEPSSDRVAAIQAAAAEENNPLNIHYDADREVRAKGAGFYQFSADEETRKEQMEELRQARHETEMTRQELGAVDLKAGEVEGMQEAPNALRSRAIEKRKRELEERRKQPQRSFLPAPLLPNPLLRNPPKQWQPRIQTPHRRQLMTFWRLLNATWQ